MFPDIHAESLAKLTSPKYESSLTIFQGAFGTPDSSLYIDENSTDILATCFFVDCVPDLVGLIKEVRRILKPGGTWVNFGPLKYHQIGGISDRLTWDELVELISLSGFRVVADEIRKGCLYLPVRLSFSHSSPFEKKQHHKFLVTRRCDGFQRRI